ncbi:PREDICTED: uncharacterized protein LOC109168928 isoform X2 [Ipomoea nil]|uniref:uncharacterized protein LOC109168928 isoform X2 n=1 Tax=Ipomoea nil TaxID=35883 RepID=UPI000900CA2F|nr:PREDICTED: uncharacterized protein LOC109168928 isoform X2 [Ipomoea nil]
MYNFIHENSESVKFRNLAVLSPAICISEITSGDILTSGHLCSSYSRWRRKRTMFLLPMLIPQSNQAQSQMIHRLVVWGYDGGVRQDLSEFIGTLKPRWVTILTPQPRQDFEETTSRPSNWLNFHLPEGEE